MEGLKNRGDTMLDKRVMSAIVAIPLLVLFTLCGGIIFKIGVAAITGIALYEYVHAYSESDNKAIVSILLIGFIIDYTLIFTKGLNACLPVIFLVTIFSMAAPIFSRKYNVVSSAVTITGFIYIICFFSFLILIRDHNHGSYLIWIVFIIAWCCDTFAYYTGKTFGRTKLCPSVSPKKTVEGSIGGILGSVLGLMIYAYITKKVDFEAYQLILLGITGSIVSQLGDLSASLIKRHMGIKDYGNIMPGHGGILDRFDSILFTAPIVYYCIIIFIG